MSDHTHGEMNTEEQERTYQGFLTGAKWLSGLSIAVLVFLAVFNS